MSSTYISNLNDDELRALLNKHNINAGPIGPSTRKVYEMKLKRILEPAGDSVLTNGNGTQTLIKEHVSEETNGESFFGFVENVAEKNFDNISRRSIVFEEEYNESPRKREGDESDAHSEFEESVRILSPEEVVRFRSSFSSNPNLKQMVEPTYEMPIANSSNTTKRIFSAVAMFIVVAITFTLFIKTNWESLTDPSEKDEV